MRIGTRVVACMAIALGGILAAIPATTAGAAQVSAKIDAQVLNAARRGTLEQFFVVLHRQANLSGASALATKNAKTSYVFNQLRQAAQASQAPVEAELKSLGFTTTPYFIVNEILATKSIKGSPTPASLSRIAALPGVAAIRPVGTPTFVDGPSPASITSLLASAGTRTHPNASPPGSLFNGWNVNWIGARQLHQQGVRGSGIVVGNIDTGVADTQPLLTTKYRGYQGPGQPVNNNYNWYDPSSAPCTSPCDAEGHGTLTMSEMVSNGIGVAPQAQWIACRGLGPGASAATVLDCLQWMLAPTDSSGKNPNPAMAPDVVSNSYICPFCGLQPAFTALANAGIYNVVVTGNYGPTCGSVFSPGDYTGVTAVGALGVASDLIAPYSGRGPVPGGPISPAITAPGTVVGAALGGGYTTMSGTSVAAPEVAGAVALLWSSDPALKGNIAATLKALTGQATPEQDGSCGPAAAPNAVYGYGELHVGVPGPKITSVLPASLPQGGSGVITLKGNNFEPGAFATFDPGSGAGVTVNSTTVVSASQIQLQVSIAPSAPLGRHPLSLIEPNGGAVTAGLSPQAGLPSFTVGTPSMSTKFANASVPMGVSTSLSFTIKNPNATSSLTGVGFSDTLPAGLQVAYPNSITDSCGGTATGVPASRLITLSGATLAANSTCAMSIRVTGIAKGYQTNVTGVVTSSEAGDGAGATSTLYVTPPMASSTAAMSATPDALGYWLASSDGSITSFGDAGYYGSVSGLPLKGPVVGLARTPSGHGYWEVAGNGGLVPFGDAGFFGSMGGQPLNAAVVGITSTPNGGGYWEVAADGGVFSFGNANFYGSMGGQPLNAAVVGITSTPNGGGYWEVAADGGVFSFGDAKFYGSMGGGG
ncbi:MAG: S8 family serine peptidase [Acidimicrobiales bacterium]